MTIRSGSLDGVPERVPGQERDTSARNAAPPEAGSADKAMDLSPSSARRAERLCSSSALNGQASVRSLPKRSRNEC